MKARAKKEYIGNFPSYFDKWLEARPHANYKNALELYHPSDNRWYMILKDALDIKEDNQ